MRFGGDFSDSELSIYNSPTKIAFSEYSEYWINPERDTSFNYYLRMHMEQFLTPVEKKRSMVSDRDLWNSFSNALVRLRLNDVVGNKYKLNCGCIPAGCSGVYKDSYLVDISDRENFEEIFSFIARRMLNHYKNDFEEYEITKLKKFFIEDFTTRKHTAEADKIGLEADTIFFP